MNDLVRRQRRDRDCLAYRVGVIDRVNVGDEQSADVCIEVRATVRHRRQSDALVAHFATDLRRRGVLGHVVVIQFCAHDLADAGGVKRRDIVGRDLVAFGILLFADPGRMREQRTLGAVYGEDAKVHLRR